MPNQTHSLDGVFHALSDPTRRAVLAELAKGDRAVSELAAPFDMALPSFLQHLKVLEDSGLVRSEKQGRVRTCTFTPEPLDRVEDWILDQKKIWEARLDRLEAYLDTLRKDRAKKDKS